MYFSNIPYSRYTLVMLIVALGLLYILELLLYSKDIWQFRRVIAVILLAINVAWLFAFVFQTKSALFTVIALIVFMFRVFNLLRIIKNRINQHYLNRAALRTSVWLSMLFAVSVIAAIFTDNWIRILPVITITQLLTSICIAIVATLSIVKLRKKRPAYHYSERDLPTVSICVPARNETEQLETCIANLLANDYPKLEILVLDDCSTDSTPEIIKKYAHDGVRFIKGASIDEGWLPKNQAYQRLFEEASGRYLIFCGVDTTFGSRTIRELVSTAMTQRLDMISVLPIRLRSTFFASIIQPMRYWWELAVPRWAFNSPPVLSTCWLIERSVLEKNGSFEAIKRSILPERHYAKITNQHRRYAFVASNHAIDVQTLKNVSDQRQTALRVRYPQIHKRPELALLLLFFEAFIFISPILIIVTNTVIQSFSFVFWVSLVVYLVNIFTHVSIVTMSNPANVPFAVIGFPIVVATELVIGIESMIRYEFSEVEWKDRNICIPVMRVIPKLPNI